MNSEYKERYSTSQITLKRKINMLAIYSMSIRWAKIRKSNRTWRWLGCVYEIRWSGL